MFEFKSRMDISTLEKSQERPIEMEIQKSVLSNDYLFSRRKRTLDLLITILSLPFTFTVIVFSAALILLVNGSPVMFKQKRIGKNGKEFIIFKLRTIKKRASNREGVLHNNGDISSIGKILRLFRFDEFPQIWNILIGNMSWVGPRPEVGYYVDKYTNLDPQFSERLKALPGITGLAQVKNPNATPNENLDKLVHDIEYIRTASLKNDLKIIVNTFFLIWK